MELITWPWSEDRQLNSVLSIPQSLALLSITGSLPEEPTTADQPLGKLCVSCPCHSDPAMTVDCMMVDFNFYDATWFSAR